MRSWLALFLAAACAPEVVGDGPGGRGPQPTTSPTSSSSTATLPELPGAATADLGDMAVAALTADPPGGTFVGAVDVTLTASEPDAEIWYTLDGSLPQAGAALPYTGPVHLEDGALLRATAEVHGAQVYVANTFLRLEATTDGFATDLPVLVLWTEGAAPVWKEEEYDLFTLTVFEPPVGGEVLWPADATLSTRAGLKIRGSSSSGYPKHPYRLETWDPAGLAQEPEGVPLLGMPEDADWVLLAPLDFDRAFVRDALMYHLSNTLGRYAARTRFAEVFVAEQGEPVGLDDYAGIYVVEERLEVGPDRVAITPLLPVDTTDPAVTGGYLFKEDRTGPDEVGFTAGTAGGTFDFQQPFVSVEPSEAELRPEQFTYLVGQLDELGEALASPGFVHPTTGRHYDQIIDVDAWIDHHILNVFAKNPDAFRLSGYFHKERSGLMAAGPVWDFDRTMGCESDTRAANPTWWDASNETTDTTYVFEHGFWPGLFADPVFRDRYFARWGELLATDLSVATVEAQLDAWELELQAAAPRNYAAWPDYPPRGGDLASEMDLLKDWIATRHAWISGCLALPDPRFCPGD